MIGAFISWRFETAACAVIPIVGHILLMMVPESPLYLMVDGRPEEARKALMWLRGAATADEIRSEFIDVRSWN